MPVTGGPYLDIPGESGYKAVYHVSIRKSLGKITHTYTMRNMGCQVKTRQEQILLALSVHQSVYYYL
jgi:hypothetical protein